MNLPPSASGDLDEIISLRSTPHGGDTTISLTPRLEQNRHRDSSLSETKSKQCPSWNLELHPRYRLVSSATDRGKYRSHSYNELQRLVSNRYVVYQMSDFPAVTGFYNLLFLYLEPCKLSCELSTAISSHDGFHSVHRYPCRYDMGYSRSGVVPSPASP